MPPYKQVRSLNELCLELMATAISAVCKQSKECCLSSLKSTFALDWLPGVLTDSLVDRIIIKLIDKRDRTLKPLFAAFKFLPLYNISKLDFRRAFMGYRLSRDLNVAFKAFCEEILVKTDRLTELVLIAKCTDNILQCIGENCQQLVHLNVAISDGITDKGVAFLAPAKKTDIGVVGDVESEDVCRPGCYNLKVFNLKDCYISPVAIAALIIDLPKLRRLYYTNMASVVQELNKFKTTSKIETFQLDYFEFYSSENENFELRSLPDTLPYLTTLKLLIKDEHMNYLSKCCSSLLQQVDVELSSDTGQGCVNFFKSKYATNLTNISLQVTSMPGDCILAIAQNCTKLNTFKLTTSSLEQEEKLVPSCRYFQNLQYLVCRVYSEEWDSSEEDEEGGQARNNQLGMRSQSLEFLVQHSLKLVELQIQAHCSNYMNVCYLAQLLQSNPLAHCEKLVIDSPHSELGRGALDLVVSNIPSLKVLMVTRWKDIAHCCIRHYKDEIKKNNWDLEII